MRLLCLTVLAVLAVAYCLIAGVGRVVRGVARWLQYVLYVHVLSLGRESAIISALHVSKRPAHVCFAFQRVLSTQDAKVTQDAVQRYVHWCSVAQIPRVTVYTQNLVEFSVTVKREKREQSEAPGAETKLTWVHAEDGVQQLVSIAKDPSKVIRSKEHLRSLTSPGEKHSFPDLLISLGPSCGMPLCGLPPLLSASAEVLYGGTRLSVLDFYTLLEQFAGIEQRFGK